MTNKDLKAYELRLSGLTFAAIAKKLGYADPSGAYLAYQRAREVITLDNLAELKLLELERLDRVLTVIWEEVLQGKITAINAFLKITDLRAKIIGLYQPEKIQMGVTMEKPEDQNLDEAVKEMGRILDYGIQCAIENNLNEPWVEKIKQKRGLN